ncbi:MAG: hypothetical protein V8Q57_03320 [Blautia sp.]
MEILGDGEQDKYGKNLGFGLYQKLEDGSFGSDRIDVMSQVPAGEYVYKAFYGKKESNNGSGRIDPVKGCRVFCSGSGQGKEDFSMDADTVLWSLRQTGVDEIWVNTVVDIEVIDENGERQGWLENSYQNIGHEL